MLDLMTSSESTQVIYTVLRELTGDTNYVSFLGSVTAKVNGKSKIDEEDIRVSLTYSAHQN